MITFDINDLIDEMIDNEISRYNNNEFKKFENINDINKAMLGITVDCDGDIITISDLNKKDYETFRKKLNKLTDKDIKNINDTIIKKSKYKSIYNNKRYLWTNN
jgi:hypothetical protein